jgi:predicted O-methyltransferase YrrM
MHHMSVTLAARRVAGGLYRRLAAPAGIRALEQALRSGLPPQLAPALRFLLRGKIAEPARQAAERVEALRAEVAARPDRFRFVHSPSPLGEIRWPEPLPDGASDAGAISARELAQRISVSQRWGVFLHLVAEGCGARTILETGACVGISGAYLASTTARPRFVTVEGSRALAEIARQTLARVSETATVIAQPFASGIDEALMLLRGEGRRVDLAYIDGHHDEQATLHYVRQILPHLGAMAVVVLDDIHLYAEMWRAWETIVGSYGFAAAVNVGRFGLLAGNGSAASTVHFDLARYTGWWRVGHSRQRSLRELESR